uniref:NET domain-containing protein n=1 Tax=Brassica oleracea var. oleracea TaxID=109376 RepID=A0A0D2ZSB1_BRAOL
MVQLIMSHDIANRMLILWSQCLLHYALCASVCPQDHMHNWTKLFGCDRDQVAELLSQEERIPHHGDGDTRKSSAEIIGADISSLEREKLKALLRQCVRDIIPGVDEMPTRARSMHLMSQLSNKKPSISVTNKEVKDDIQLLMKSDPGLFKGIVKKHTDDVLASLNDMQQQAEKLLDTVATSCSGRPLSQEEKRDLQKSIKELPRGNLKRVAEIIRDHYVASGKEFSDEVTVNLEEEDNVTVWRMHFYVAVVKSARKLGSTGTYHILFYPLSRSCEYVRN